ncbi:CinA family protein [Streptacidiphilus sp. EB129]|uniref:CinA family protein n=1 Tax=Streptacidiphilus sp. EB129 TaxID=3156262 RepID=UPI0035141EB8
MSVEPTPTPAARALRRLEQLGATVAVAESLTGGLVAGWFVDVPGASRSFRGSVTAYATDLKGSVLGVDRSLLDQRGAVDPEVAVQMAQGVRRLMGADYGVATTGVAGPEPQDGKAVGTAYVAVAGPDAVLTVSLAEPGTREQVRSAAAAAAVELLCQVLDRASDRVAG